MACIEVPLNADSEMEEGEIVDDVDELSDISSEEEFLLRQRLQVLENYNNVLERKQAKRTTNGNLSSNAKRPKKEEEIVLCDLSDVSEADFEDSKIQVSQRFLKRVEPVKLFKRRKQIKEPEKVLNRNKDIKKKSKQNKKKNTNKLCILSSDDSDDEYSDKRRKLANAVALKKIKRDTSTLKDRINSMLFGPKKPSNIIEFKKTGTLAEKLGIPNKITNLTNLQEKCENNNKTDTGIQTSNIIQIDDIDVSNVKVDNSICNDSCKTEEKIILNEPTQVLCTDTVNLCTDNEVSQDVLDSGKNEKANKIIVSENKSEASSDDDLELLRQNALKTKSAKSKNNIKHESIANSTENKPTVASEDEDSDTAELRLICLKSSLLKKAIEMKQKQKLRKRLSQSTCLQDDFMLHDEILKVQSENNTDIESVDMDIGSDGEERSKENSNTVKHESQMCDNINNDDRKEDELEEDEDLLRAKLLTSLSKNLPNLVDISIFNTDNEGTKPVKKDKVTSDTKVAPIQEEKKFIIQLGESDSEGEHEATKNLTKMHMKLAEHYQDFQSKLDTLLKSTRKEFEKDTLSTLPDVVQKPALPKPAPKFVPKAMNHLPKSEQIEYKNLVKRMAELEKIKQARSSLTSSQNKTTIKETLKPRNVSSNTKLGNNLEQKIALSRKKIAEESAKVLKLKEEAKKLSQKYKIVATELKNISTAINLNKKQQRAVHGHLQQIRLQHQLLLKGSNLNTLNSNRIPPLSRIQKENNPTAKDTSYNNLLKSVKVSVVNDVNKDACTEPRLSVQLDVTNNKKTIKLPKSPPKARVVDIVPNMYTRNSHRENETETNTCQTLDEKGGGNIIDEHNKDVVRPTIREQVDEKGRGNIIDEHNMDVVRPSVREQVEVSIDDYKSPLAALGHTTWTEDPNAFLCPYEVSGSCRDPDCKYLHPKLPSH